MISCMIAERLMQREIRDQNVAAKRQGVGKQKQQMIVVAYRKMR